MEGQQYVQLPPGTTECNHSYYAGNSFSASHSVQQSENGTIATCVQPLAYTQEANGVASSGFVSSPLLPRSANSSQVPACPTRTVTGVVMPLAEAITQLSFLEFLQHCGVSIAPSQPSQLPAPISLLDAAVQATPRCDAFQDVSTQTSDQQVSSLSFDVAVQTSPHGIHISSLDAAVQTTPQSTPSQHVSTQMGSRSVSSFSVDILVLTPIRSVVLHDVAIQLPITELFTGCIFSNDPLNRQNFVREPPSSVQGPRALLQPPPGLEQLVPPPDLATSSHLHTTHGASTISYPSHAPQPPVCTTLVGTHPVRSATTGKRGASTALAGTHNPVGADPRTGTGPFPEPRALVLPMVKFGQPKSDRLGHIDTVDSDLMHHQFRLPFFSGIQARRAEILPTLSPLLVESSMRLFCRKPVIMFRTSPISSWRTLATRTSLSCSTRTPLSLTQKFSHSRPTLRAKVLGVWSCSLFEAS